MKERWIEPGKTIGILGGGQLGRMMALSAREMGYRIVVLEPTPNSPCGQVADLQIQTTYDDLDGARKLAEMCDVLTYEFENIDAYTANWLEENLYLPQGSRLLSITQDRVKEKETVSQFNCPVVPYEVVHSLEDLKAGVENLGMPSVLKTTRGGYDGKGQFVIREETHIQTAWDELDGRGPFVLEKWIPFDKEISVIVTRGVTGEIATFPVVENIHVNNILYQSIVPARIPLTAEKAAVHLALQLAESLQLVGTLAVEMFLTENGDIYVNELAPRPHNSGHYTNNACETSQFEQHIRAICGWPLGKTDLFKPVVMVNILGEHLENVLKHIHEIEGAHLHLYGKAESRVGRKMGHVNVLADSVEDALHEINSTPIWTKEREETSK